MADSVMADSSASLVREGGSEEGVSAVGIELESVNQSPAAQSQENDDPPEYTTVLDGEVPAVDAESPPLCYEASLAASLSDTQPKRTLTVEAPPSYVQLFGKSEEEPDGAVPNRRQRRQRRRHTVRRGRAEGEGGRWTGVMNRIFKDSKSTVICGVVIFSLILTFTLAISMISLGFTYYNSCSVTEVPLYLIVTGFLFLVEIIVQSLLCTAQKFSEDESFYYAVRKFDCLLFFLFVWLLVGSYWVVQAGKRDQECFDGVVDYVIIAGNTTDDVITPNTDWEQRPITDCSDCPGGVYMFTVLLILFQYLVALVLGICCCTSSVKSRRRN